MKKLLFILILFITNVGFVSAQGQHGVIKRKPNTTINKKRKNIYGNSSKAEKKAVTNKDEKHSSLSNNKRTPINTNQRVINYPFTTKRESNDVIIVSVVLNNKYTAITMSETSYDINEWISIKSNTYIKAQGKAYFLSEAKGINIEPQKTYFTSVGQTITFTLYFAPIPLNTQSINLIEPGESKWKFYGIELK